MEKKIAIGLIKLDVLNNIDAQDAEALQYLKRNDDDFPWKEYGDYQNLVALIAVTSKIEEPNPDLKDKILSRLYAFKKSDTQDKVFETIEENNSESHSYAEETTQKFKIETNGEKTNFNEGPVVEVEEFEIGESNEPENKIEKIPDEKELQQENISEVKNVVDEEVKEQIYEIEEYDLEMAHEDHIAERAENAAATLVEIPQPEEEQQSLYEIEEYDFESEEKKSTENIVDEQEDIQNVIPEILNEEPEIIQEIIEEADETEIFIPAAEEPVKFEIESEQIIEEVKEPETEISYIAAEEPVKFEISSEQLTENQTIVVEDIPIQKDDDVIIYDENESVDQLASEIMGNVTESTHEIISETKLPETLNVKETEIQKSDEVNTRPAKSETIGDSISFKEPNLSQLHILFKDSQDLVAKEKEIRQEYRAKINKDTKEKTEKPVLHNENKSDNEFIVETKPAEEIKNAEPEIITQKITKDDHEISVPDSSNEKIKSPVKLKKETSVRSNKKVIFMAAAIIIICVSVLFLMQSSDEIKGEQINVVKTDEEPQSYEDIVEEKKPEGLVIVEEIQPIKQQNTVALKTENKLPAPPQKPKMIEPEVITEIVNTPADKIVNNETEKKEVEQTPPKNEKKIEEETTYFVAVEEMPSPIGGLAGIQSKVYYPNIAKLAGVEGKVLVLAFVDESGSVTKVELVKGIGAGCDEVALDAVRQTKFKPGVQRGKPVKVRITIPIVFKKS